MEAKLSVSFFGPGIRRDRPNQIRPPVQPHIVSDFILAVELGLITSFDTRCDVYTPLTLHPWPLCAFQENFRRLYLQLIKMLAIGVGLAQWMPNSAQSLQAAPGTRPPLAKSVKFRLSVAVGSKASGLTIPSEPF